MTDFNDIKLSEIDPEDFGGTLVKLEKSFGIKLAYDSFKDAKTFGDICDIFERHINYINKKDCTTQQAFYKVRNAISLTQNFNEKDILPQSRLEEIFTRPKRRKSVKLFEQALGFPVDILSVNGWLAFTIFVGLVLSLIAFCYSWIYALGGLTFFTLVSLIANRFAKELNVSTVGELTEKISREHYSIARRYNGTVNRNEIVKTIEDVFIAEHLFIDRKNLRRDALLGWK